MSCFRCMGIRHCPQRLRFLRIRRKKHPKASECEHFLTICPCSNCIVKPVCDTLKQARYHQFGMWLESAGIDVIKCKARDTFTLDFEILYKNLS